MTLILASASPRRASLLSSIGLKFDVIPSNVDESDIKTTSIMESIAKLAARKASTISALHPNAFVIAADTVVLVPSFATQEQWSKGGGRIFGKPVDTQDAFEMLNKLQGITHSVISGFCLANKSIDYCKSRTVQTDVEFSPMTPAEIRAYVASGEPEDKAGAYAIQGIGGAFIRKINGSYTNVVGLPMAEVIEELKACKISYLQYSTEKSAGPGE
ncbi:MAG: septum formation protein Maf [Deltaproteobacteria bacterium]|nr:septum formation protein Maf [Deltaproteobacteria bacterium]